MSMSVTFKFFGGKGAARVRAALAICTVLLTGCAGTISHATDYSAQTEAHPDNIYVYSFSSSPDQVQLDSGRIQKLKSRFDAGAASQKQATEASDVQKEVADRIVSQLQAMGLRAIRSDVPAPEGQNVLLVKGDFDTIDAGNRRRRTLVGLGAGESKLSTSVEVLYKPANGPARVVQRFDASADSGKAPGVAETGGLGAAAGHVSTSVVAGVGLHAVSEKKQSDFSSDATRLADSIARHVAEIGVEEGWMSSSQVKGS
jgi:Domain of unknown function (DUF4410)